MSSLCHMRTIVSNSVYFFHEVIYLIQTFNSKVLLIEVINVKLLRNKINSEGKKKKLKVIFSFYFSYLIL